MRKKRAVSEDINHKRKCLCITHGLLKFGTGMYHVSMSNLKALQGVFGAQQTEVILLGNRHDVEKKGEQPEWDVRIASPTILHMIWNCLNRRYDLDPKIEKDIIQRIQEQGITHCFIDDTWYGRMAMIIKKHAPETEITVFFHDVRKILSKQWLKSRSIFYYLVFYTIKNNEQWAARYADKIIVLNDRDNSQVKRCYSREADAVVPVCLEDQFLADGKVPSPMGCTITGGSIALLFVGAHYIANVKGVLWFCREVMPHLSGVMLTIVGKGMEKMDSIIRPYDHVAVRGFVQDLGEYYRCSHAVVAPIFEGGGMKVKTAEALMYGKTVFGTSEAFQGYALDFDKVGGLCDTAADYISRIRRWIEENRMTLFNRYSREQYEKKHTFSGMLKKFYRLYGAG